MQLEFLMVQNRGFAPLENVYLVATEDCDLERSLLLCGTSVETGFVLNRLKPVFWLPHGAQAKAYDEIHIYTRSGTPRRMPLSDGRNRHFFYLNQDLPFWGDSAAVPILLTVSDWVGKPLQAH